LKREGGGERGEGAGTAPKASVSARASRAGEGGAAAGPSFLWFLLPPSPASSRSGPRTKSMILPQALLSLRIQNRTMAIATNASFLATGPGRLKATVVVVKVVVRRRERRRKRRTSLRARTVEAAAAGSGGRGGGGGGGRGGRGAAGGGRGGGAERRGPPTRTPGTMTGAETPKECSSISRTRAVRRDTCENLRDEEGR